MNEQPQPRVLVSPERVSATVNRVARELTKDYSGKNPVLVGVLKGSFVFMSDLVRALDFPLEVEFLKVASYGRGRSAPGKLRLVNGLREPIKNRDVLVVEDIVDTGRCVSFLLEYLARRKPASLKLCVMVDKPSRRECEVKIDYLGLTVPDKFIVGYGMDWDEKFRNLPYIGYLEM